MGLNKDYCSEAHLTRRLNDLGCKNVINVSGPCLRSYDVHSNEIVGKVVEWAYIGEKFWRNETGKISRSEPRHRICYEYADYGDLWDLIAWYYKQRYRSHLRLWTLWSSLTQAQTASFFRKHFCGMSSTPWRTPSAIAAMEPINHCLTSGTGIVLFIWILSPRTCYLPCLI